MGLFKKITSFFTDVEDEEVVDSSVAGAVDTDAMWADVVSKLENVKIKASHSKGKAYMIVASPTHKKSAPVWYCARYSTRAKLAYVCIETNGGAAVRDAIMAIVETSPKGHVCRLAKMEQGSRSKEKWELTIATPIDKPTSELVKWYTEMMTELYGLFEAAEPIVFNEEDEKAAAEKAERDRARAEADKAANERVERIKAEAEKEKAEIEQRAKAAEEATKAMNERLEAEAEKRAAEIAESAKAQVEATRAEIERIKAEKARLEAEKAKVEAEKAAAEKAAAEKAKAEAELAKMRTELEAAQKAKAEAEKTDTAAAPAGGDTFDVILKSAGHTTLAVIKAVKEVAGLSLGDAKAIVDTAPMVTIKKGISKEEAESIKSSLEEAGAEVKLKANLLQGALPAVFTVSKDGKKVRFSQGLLQFNPAKYEFRFAERQYDIIGEDNEKIAPNYDGWIDLFGWGTSGYIGCQPTEISDKDEEYGPNKGDITGTNYDWGVYNPITNGGNKEGIWRTMTKEEWDYLVKYRPKAAKLKVPCTICGREGYMLLPDDFWNNRLRFPMDITTNSFSTNPYNAEQFAQLEEMGVVFMPKAGYRMTSSSGCKEYTSSSISYWLSSRKDTLLVYIASFNANYDYYRTAVGCPVRLVKDEK